LEVISSIVRIALPWQLFVLSYSILKHMIGQELQGWELQGRELQDGDLLRDGKN
jgi:hypothetical protein